MCYTGITLRGPAYTGEFIVADGRDCSKNLYCICREDHIDTSRQASSSSDPGIMSPTFRCWLVGIQNTQRKLWFKRRQEPVVEIHRLTDGQAIITYLQRKDERNSVGN